MISANLGKGEHDIFLNMLQYNLCLIDKLAFGLKDIEKKHEHITNLSKFKNYFNIRRNTHFITLFSILI